MQGTEHAPAIQITFAKRCTAMRTEVIDRVKRAAEVEEGDLLIACADRLARLWRKVCHCRDLIEFLFAGHRLRIMPNLPRSLNPPMLPFTIAKTSCLGSKCALQTHSGERFSKSRKTSA